MHIAPVVIVPHTSGPGGWMAALDELARVLDAHPYLPVTLRAPGAAIEHVWRSDPSLGARLAAGPVAWLAGGWSDPVLADLPLPDRDLQLTREQAAMSTAGIVASGLWVGDGWEPALVSLAVESDLPLLFMDIALVPSSHGRPGAVERAGQVAMGIPVGTSASETSPDGLVPVRVEPADLEEFASRYRGRLSTVVEHFVDHHPGPRLAPVVSSPRRGPAAETFYRKLLLLTANRADRKGSLEEVLALQSREFVTGDGGGIGAHARLIAARQRVERNRYRGDSWVATEEVDWDADGIDEIHTETAAASLVLDPVSGHIEVWDDKARAWSILALQSPPGAAICRRLGPDGAERTQGMLRLDRRTEGRSEAQFRLVGDDGGVYQVTLRDDKLTIEMTLPPIGVVRVGPEVPVSMDAKRARLRVDGGAWSNASQPLAVSGHRFRLTDGDHSLVISAPRPTDLFVEPLTGYGVQIWPHWATDGDTSYAVTLAPT